ncbi:MAG: AsmA-like C-terminal region-containing protein [Candidatus Pseudobacter hemicellulosilyticus]|uniref:AsmA-like C-terminal region-containing protein n=1 Tax=Candidatus Pseudobacter hemicellulosilyticus TaxID=3121375 RepID=A0AAJ5WSP1_9BACT|nr:MAG: AsmA-like C-terminal region-containing protein [Pseudobacter sp.]
MAVPGKKKRSIKKRIFRGLLIFLAIFFVLIGVAVLLLFTQQERITRMAIDELNKQFKGAITLERSNINLVENFPNVSVALHGVQFFPDKSRTGRPIYQLEHLYVGFSLPDIFKQQYNVRRLMLKGGKLDLVQEKNGQLNLVEAKNLGSDTASSKAPDSAAALQINLRRMVLRDMDISYLDKSSMRRFSTHIDKLSASFKTDSSQLQIALKADMELDMTSPTDTSFFRHKQLQLDIAADFDKQKHFLALTRGGISLQDAALTITGTAALAKESQVDFVVKGDKPDMNLIAAFIPGDVKAILKPFKYDGHLSFDGTIKGALSKEKLPLIELNFGLQDAWFLNTGADRKLDQLGFSGFYTNGSEHNLHTSELRMTNVSAKPGKGVFDGNFVIRDFTDPHVLMQLKSELELQFIGEFLGIPDLKHITGKVKLDMNFKELTDLQFPEKALHKLKEGVQSELTVEDLSFRIPNYPHPVRDMNLHAVMRNGRIVLDTLRLKVANSDLRVNGSLSDLLAVLHAHDKPVSLALNISSDKLVLKELFAHDTAKAAKMEEEIRGFNIGLALATSVQQLRHPAPLPKGVFELKQLRAAFKKYPHAFHDLGATVTINDTALLLRNLTGMIDQSDLRFSGRVINYALWFDPIKKGKTQVAFDFKSNRLAMADLLGPISKTWVSESYQEEEANNLWLRARADLRYDTSFKFVKLRIANISGSLKKHRLKLDSISGGLLYGNKIVKVDTLKGKIGRTDFDLNLRLYAGDNKELKKKTNYLYFRSEFLDADQLLRYNFESFAAVRPTPAQKPAPSPAQTPTPDQTPVTAAAPMLVTNAVADHNSMPVTASTASNPADTSDHAKAFNIFLIPFPDFEVRADIGRLKYKRLGLTGITAHLRTQEDHMIYVDTMGMNVADGTMGIRGYLNGTNPQKIFFNSRIRVNDVDLEKVMIRLDHFGQDLVINKNIKGIVSGQIKSHVQVHPDLVPLINDSKAELDIEIVNGSLVDFAPMQAMAGYFKDKNLRMVRFDTLRNVLTFRNGTLDIPSMNINSSLGFMEISGKQSMDLTMEYYMRIPLKMVTQVGFRALFGRKQEEVDMDQVDEIEFRDKDKRVRFMNIKVTGTPEDYKIGLGKDKRKKN